MLHVRPTSVLLLLTSALVVPMGSPARADAQAGGRTVEVHGFVRAADSGAPLAGATVTLVGTGSTAITHGDGHFHVRAPAYGTHQIRVERMGYRTVVLELSLPAAGDALEIRMERAAVDLPGLVVTGSLTERGADQTISSVNVLAGDRLQRRLAETVADMLASEPGVAVSSMGPATGQPVIRGLGGDRVLILEDGFRVGDVSNTGPDHAVATDGKTARRVEVLRGPAALRYGSSALGGVVNVIRDEIPMAPVHHVHGTATLRGRTVNQGMEAGLSAVAPLTEGTPLRFEFSGRTAGDLRTPVGALVNTGMDAWAAGAGTALIREWGSLGGAVRYHANDYGIPGGFVGGHEEGVRIEMERSSTKGQLRLKRPVGPFSSLDVDGAYTWHRLMEFEAPDILGTFFKRQTASLEVVGRHTHNGALSGGAAGVRASWERHDFAGSLDTPDSYLTTLAAFAVEELDLDPVRLEAGLRYDWVRADPIQKNPRSRIGNIRTRTFHAASGSLGALVRVAHGVSVGGSAARAFRTPHVNELFSEGPHLAAYIFEVGNPELGTEVGTGLDAFVRFASAGVRGEVTGFVNRISGYIYPRETGDTSRVGLPVVQFEGEDATLAGFEAQAQVSVVEGLLVEGNAAYVRGTLTGSGEPLPLIPPFRGRGAVEFTRPGWFVRGEVEVARRQARLGEFETPTDGYAVYHASAGVRHTIGGRLNSVTLSFENLTNRTYRNHLSRVREIMPEAGRGLNVTYRVVF